MEDFSTHTQTFAEAAGTYGTDHEFLEADGGIGVGTAVDDVHHRNRQNFAVAAADVAEQGQIQVVGSCVGTGQRNTQQSVGTQIALGFGAVEFDHGSVDFDLIHYIHTFQFGEDLFVDIVDSGHNAFAQVTALIAVTQFKSFVFTGGGTGGDCCTAFDAAFESYFDFEGGVAAGIEDFAGVDIIDCRHRSYLLFLLNVFGLLYNIRFIRH